VWKRRNQRRVGGGGLRGPKKQNILSPCPTRPPRRLLMITNDTARLKKFIYLIIIKNPLFRRFFTTTKHPHPHTKNKKKNKKKKKKKKKKNKKKKKY
ncbi:hypothetical protein, partial [Enterobacter sichuanensis]